MMNRRRKEKSNIAKLLWNHNLENIQRTKCTSKTYGQKFSEKYMAELRSFYHEYGDFLEEILRDRFVCGVGHERVQH